MGDSPGKRSIRELPLLNETQNLFLRVLHQVP